ncbi:hypothetical protein [Nocardia sp. NPDC005366]|uniref:hypothetical protein n=1 Tax=Nocardia sp. NPDC005366 TaxID=3156878 RepID=UPI0033B063DC
MRATVGLSVEQTAVRGVIVSCTPEDDAPEPVLRTVEEPVADGAGAVPGVLDRIVAAVAPDIRIENVAVVYRTVEERRAIVSRLSAGGWSSASLVSLRSALLAAVRAVPGQERYGPVLVVETVDRRTSYALVDAARTRVLASDTWQPGIIDAESAAAALTRIRQQGDSPSSRPQAVLLCGAAAGVPAIAAAFDSGLGVPVLQVPGAATMAARGAALIASSQIEDPDRETSPAVRARLRRPVLIAAAVIAVLGATGLAVAQIDDNHPAASRAGDLSTEPAVTPPPPVVPISPAILPVEPVPPVPPVPPVQPAPELPAPESNSPTETTAPPEPVEPDQQPALAVAPEPPADQQAPPDEAQPVQPGTTKVGAPDGNGLFPGESAPPPAGADPEVARQWWDNHWSLKQRWLNDG